MMTEKQRPTYRKDLAKYLALSAHKFLAGTLNLLPQPKTLEVKHELARSLFSETARLLYTEEFIDEVREIFEKNWELYEQMFEEAKSAGVK